MCKSLKLHPFCLWTIVASLLTCTGCINEAEVDTTGYYVPQPSAGFLSISYEIDGQLSRLSTEDLYNTIDVVDRPVTSYSTIYNLPTINSLVFAMLEGTGDRIVIRCSAPGQPHFELQFARGVDEKTVLTHAVLVTDENAQSRFTFAGGECRNVRYDKRASLLSMTFDVYCQNTEGLLVRVKGTANRLPIGPADMGRLQYSSVEDNIAIDKAPIAEYWTKRDTLFITVSETDPRQHYVSRTLLLAIPNPSVSTVPTNSGRCKLTRYSYQLGADTVLYLKEVLSTFDGDSFTLTNFDRETKRLSGFFVFRGVNGSFTNVYWRERDT